MYGLRSCRAPSNVARELHSRYSRPGVHSQAASAFGHRCGAERRVTGKGILCVNRQEPLSGALSGVLRRRSTKQEEVDSRLNAGRVLRGRLSRSGWDEKQIITLVCSIMRSHLLRGVPRVFCGSSCMDI